MPEKRNSIEVMEAFIDVMSAPVNEKLDLLKSSVQNQVNEISKFCTDSVSRAKAEFDASLEDIKKLASESKAVRDTAIKDIKESGGAVKLDIAKTQSELVKRIGEAESKFSQAMSDFSANYVKKTDDTIKILSDEIRSLSPLVASLHSKGNRFMQGLEVLARAYSSPEKKE